MINRYLLSYHLPPKGVLLLPEGGELSYHSVTFSIKLLFRFIFNKVTIIQLSYYYY